LEAGRRALEKAIAVARADNYVAQISLAIEKEIRAAGFSPIEALTGHGVGKKLHEEPPIPCFWRERPEDSPRILAGMVLAIEVIYGAGRPGVVLDANGWTVETADGQPAGLFEQTVAVTARGPIVITA
jgi:methionyl aminopeptidase